MSTPQSFVQERASSSPFFSKVMTWFGVALLVTAGGVYAGFNYFLSYFVETPALMYAVFALELGLVFTSTWWSKKEPLNYFLFSLFAFASGVTLVPLLAYTALESGSYEMIYRALFATTVTFLAMGIIGYTSKRSFLGLSGFLFYALLGMIVVGILGIFIPWGNTMEMIYSGIGVAIFSAYAMVDVQRLKLLPEEDAMHAAMSLYLDIFNLFVYILRLMRALSRD